MHRLNERCDQPYYCEVCGRKSYTTRGWVGRVKYCSDKCKRDGYNRARRARTNGGPGAPQGKVGGPWRIIRDPDESWSHHSTLTLNEARDLVQRGYLAIGLELRHEKLGSVYCVTNGQRGLRLEKIA
jgi:hypothetical protein